MTIHIDVVEDLDALAAVGAKWDQLAVRTLGQSPMTAYAWTASYLEHLLPEGDRWQVLLARRGDDLVGVLPLVRRKERVLGLRREVLHLPYDGHLPCSDAVTDEAHRAEVYDALLRHLEKEAGPWFALRLPHLPDHSATLARVRTWDHVRIYERSYERGNLIETRGSFEDYLASRSPKHRSNLRRSERKLEKIGPLEWQVSDGQQDLERDLQRFFAVEDSSWKGAGQGSIAGSPGLVRYYQALCARWARLDRLRFYFLTAGDRTVAGTLAFRTERTLTGWKLGYDQEHAKASPGHYMVSRVVETCCEDPEIDDYDLVSGDPWQEKARTATRPYFTILAYPRRPLPMLLGVWPRRVYRWLRGTGAEDAPPSVTATPGEA